MTTSKDFQPMIFYSLVLHAKHPVPIIGTFEVGLYEHRMI